MGNEVQSKGNVDISIVAMDVYWQQRKVYDVGVTLFKLWMLTGNRETLQKFENLT
jgi:hypothetical protein